ncbi:hypothetical protein AMJ52_07990 [candidate division TA06 bacterium DG_78]|uniref:Secretion system C-terminal sorting domain-containing protein n=1 Tax=candidate division TA06 bacterium DG_78 TaxID=1703772 RepID=A0A0S7YB24_UNCT6|nr:MAG: hypothetical protein AMJ52_07990 [candidate division TA06 bacterium DG_78]
MIRDSSTGIEEIAQNTAPFVLDLYPNPLKTSLTICASTPLHGIKVYDVLGDLVIEVTMIKPKNTTTVSVKNLSAGVYFLKVRTEDAEFIRKIVVTK